MKVLVGASSFNPEGEAMNLLKEKGIEVILNPYGRKMTEDEITEQLSDVDGLLAGLEPLNEKVLQSANKLKAIARIGIGMDNVNQQAAKALSIKVSNTPDGPTDAVAEMTLTALLSIEHHLVDSNDEMHNRIWKKHLGKSISELCIFFIGYGRIGRKTADLMKNLGAKILAYDKYNPSVTNCSLEEGLARADVISLHASGGDCIVSEEAIKNMKDGVVVLNSARGSLIDDEAVYTALKSGKIAFYWGDAHPEEPYSGILCDCANAVLTPHICTYTTSCRSKMELQAVRNLLRDLDV